MEKYEFLKAENATSTNTPQGLNLLGCTSERSGRPSNATRPPERGNYPTTQQLIHQFTKDAPTIVEQEVKEIEAHARRYGESKSEVSKEIADAKNSEPQMIKSEVKFLSQFSDGDIKTVDDLLQSMQSGNATEFKSIVGSFKKDPAKLDELVSGDPWGPHGDELNNQVAESPLSLVSELSGTQLPMYSEAFFYNKSGQLSAIELAAQSSSGRWQFYSTDGKPHTNQV